MDTLSQTVFFWIFIHILPAGVMDGKIISFMKMIPPFTLHWAYSLHMDEIMDSKLGLVLEYQRPYIKSQN